MYIEWQLPKDVAFAMRVWIHKEIENWSEKHSIPYKTKSIKYTYRLILKSEEEYTFFALTWNPQGQQWLNYSIKDPMNIDRNR
jgi:hypothetical protein